MAKQAAKSADQNNQDNQGGSQEQLELLTGKLSEAAEALKMSQETNKKLEERLAALEARNQQASEDDDAVSVQKLLQKLGEEDDSQVRRAQSKGKSLDELKPSQLLDVVAEVFDEALNKHSSVLEQSVTKKLEATQDGFLKKLEGTQKIVGQLIGHLGVQEARSKFKDWDDVAADVRKKMAEVPGISIDDAYMIVKARRHEEGVPADLVDSEVPSSRTTRTGRSPDLDAAITGRRRQAIVDDDEGGRNEDTGVRRAGASDFRKLLSDKIDTVLARRR